MKEDVVMEYLMEQDEQGFQETMGLLKQRIQKPCLNPDDIPTEDMQIALKHLYIGGYVETAFQMIGINRDRVYEWLEQAQEDMQQGKISRYSALAITLKGIQGQAEHRLLGLLSSRDSKAFWQQWAWVLERTRMSRFGNKQLIITEDVTGRINAPPPANSFDTWLSDTRKRLAIADLVQRDAQDISCEEIVDQEAGSTGQDDEVEVISLLMDGK